MISRPPSGAHRVVVWALTTYRDRHHAFAIGLGQSTLAVYIDIVRPPLARPLARIPSQTASLHEIGPR